MPAPGERPAKQPPREPPAPADRCANCEATLTGPYCHECGQRAAPLLGPFREVAGPLVRDMADVDSRVVRTLRALAIPGRLTQEYVAGRGAAYLPPLRLYLIASFVYFLILSATDTTSFFFFTPGSGGSAAEESARTFMTLLPRLSIVLLPAYALLLKLLYPRWLFAVHLVFALHYHAFAELALSIHTVLSPYSELVISVFSGTQTPNSQAVASDRAWWAIALSVLDAAIQLLVFVYLYMALRRVYGSGRLGAFGRMMGLWLGYSAVLILTAFAVLRLTGAG
jgi:hypothetical protein